MIPRNFAHFEHKTSNYKKSDQMQIVELSTLHIVM